MKELRIILQAIAEHYSEEIALPAAAWLRGEIDNQALRDALDLAEPDPLTERSLQLITMLDGVAPCALLCHTCFGYRRGAVSACAKTMQALWQGWEEGHIKGYGENPSPQQKERLARLRIFNETLEELQKAPCVGCRAMGDKPGCIPGCIIPACTKEHGVLFCADCPDFPCDRNEGILQENVLKKWREGGLFLRENGLELYFQTMEGVGHYCEFADEDEGQS